jgi:hypothetical protein
MNLVSPDSPYQHVLMPTILTNFQVSTFKFQLERLCAQTHRRARRNDVSESALSHCTWQCQCHLRLTAAQLAHRHWQCHRSHCTKPHSCRCVATHTPWRYAAAQRWVALLYGLRRCRCASHPHRCRCAQHPHRCRCASVQPSPYATKLVW